MEWVWVLLFSVGSFTIIILVAPWLARFGPMVEDYWDWVIDSKWRK